MLDRGQLGQAQAWSLAPFSPPAPPCTLPWTLSVWEQPAQGHPEVYRGPTPPVGLGPSSLITEGPPRPTTEHTHLPPVPTLPHLMQWVGPLLRTSTEVCPPGALGPMECAHLIIPWVRLRTTLRDIWEDPLPGLQGPLGHAQAHRGRSPAEGEWEQVTRKGPIWKEDWEGNPRGMNSVLLKQPSLRVQSVYRRNLVQSCVTQLVTQKRAESWGDVCSQIYMYILIESIVIKIHCTSCG